jgi:ubiquinone/menaquinone biosynthesis C-methylase UbiE/uncharacterized protein YbaR (Trm112 family)
LNKEHLRDVLRCSDCSGMFDIADDRASCDGCGSRFPVVDGIPVLLRDTTIGTRLDVGDYEAMMGIDEKVISQTGTEWSDLIAGIGATSRDVLEVGAGTGALTLGLLQANAVRHLTSMDVSLKFLRALAPRVAQYSVPVSLIACDANESHFRPEAFDLVVGKSILHHLLDYDQTLRQCHSVLKPGGVAVFLEPVLEGQTVTSLFMALMLRCDEEMNGGKLSPAERQLIRKQVRHQMKSTIPLDRESLANMEDKYIFAIDELRQLGRDVGFAEVDFVSGEMPFGYWAYISHSCKILGVAVEHVKSYQWIEQEYAATFGAAFPDKRVAPIGYFIFRRKSA